MAVKPPVIVFSCSSVIWGLRLTRLTSNLKTEPRDTINLACCSQSPALQDTIPPRHSSFEGFFVMPRWACACWWLQTPSLTEPSVSFVLTQLQLGKNLERWSVCRLNYLKICTGSGPRWNWSVKRVILSEEKILFCLFQTTWCCMLTRSVHTHSSIWFSLSLGEPQSGYKRGCSFLLHSPKCYT